METNNQLSRRDFILITFIGISFGLFSIPILININLPFLPLNGLTYILIVIAFAVLANIAIIISAFIAKFIPIVLQIAKFSAVGAFNTFLDWGILNVLMATTGIASGIGFIAFKSISFIISNIGSYFWNKHWTFGSENKSSNKEFGSFFLVSIIGLIINAVLAYIIVTIFADSKIDPKRLGNIGAAVATIASLIWNFLGYKFIVFKKNDSNNNQI